MLRRQSVFTLSIASEGTHPGFDHFKHRLRARRRNLSSTFSIAWLFRKRLHQFFSWNRESQSALSVLLNSPEFIATFAKVGDRPVFESTLFESVEQFVLKLYGLKGCADVNEGRYVKFTSAKITPPPQKLPPTRDALLCHCKRVSFVTSMVKKSFEADFEMPSPNGHGWSIDDNGTLSIVWIILPPAPNGVLQLVSCNCRKSACQKGNCNCLSYKLSCTDLCGCGDYICQNRKVDDSIESGSDSEGESCDDDSDGDNDDKDDDAS